MKLRQLFEAPRKVAVAAFGRMNPPTIGHEKLVNKITGIDGDHYLFLSQTQKPKDNPLPFDVKLEFSKKFFPSVNVGHPTVRTPIQMLQMLEKLGYTDIVYVAGSDRVEQFEKLFNDYNGKEYNFNSIQVVSAGERDPDADGAEGMSASKMRAAAASGDFDSFAQGVPTPALAQKLYDAVRTGMGIKDAVPAESLDDPWGPQGNFAGDTKVDIGGTTLKKIESGDIVSYFGEKSEVVDINYAKNYARISANGKTLNVKLSDLKQLGQGVAEGAPIVVAQAPIHIRNPKKDQPKQRYMGDIVPPTQPPSTEKRGVKGRPGQRPMPKYDEASYEGNIGIMELFKFFSKAEKEDPKLVAKVKEMIKQRRDKEVWRIIQDYTGTQLTGKEFEGSIKEAIFREAGHGKYWCSTDKKWKYRQGPKQTRSS